MNQYNNRSTFTNANLRHYDNVGYPEASYALERLIIRGRTEIFYTENTKNKVRTSTERSDLENEAYSRIIQKRKTITDTCTKKRSTMYGSSMG